MARLHDIDTIKAAIVQPLPFGNYFVEEQGREYGIRLLGFDGCETTRTRKAVGPISDAEIAQGIRGRNAMQAMLDAGGRWQVSPPTPDEKQKKTYNRLLGWGRIVMPDKSIVYAAEWAKANKFDRTEFLKSATPSP